MSQYQRLPFNALRAFEAVARLGSVSRAAVALNVQPSAVSMQLRNLAEYAGVALLAKNGRSLELTSDGHILFAAVTDGLTRIEDGVAHVRRSTRSASFVISVLPSFLHLWLAPRLASLEGLLQNRLKIKIAASRELVDPRRGAADACIRLGAGRWSGLHAEKIMEEGLVPVCAPSLAKKVGWLEFGSAPRGVPVLHTSIDTWDRWGRDASSPPVRLGVEVDDAVSVVHAAEQGRGVALVRSSLAERSISGGRLMAVGPVMPYRWSYYWVCAPGAKDDPRQRAIADWIKSQAPSQVRELVMKPAVRLRTQTPPQRR